MIHLSHFATAYTSTPKYLEDWGMSAHYFEDVFHKIESSLVYPVINLAKKVHLSEKIRDCLENRPPTKQAFILAAGNGHFAGLQTPDYGDKALTYQYKMLPMTLTQIFASKFAQKYGHFEHISVDSSACASSLHVLGQVHQLIEQFEFDRVFVLAVDDAVSPAVMQFFAQSGALAKGAPSAFDETNQGFLLGQGAVLAVFEEDKMLSTTRPYAQLLGAYSASEDCFETIGQRNDGQGFARSIEGLEKYFGKYDYSVIKTHGSGTKSNNLAERNGLKCLNTQWVATAYKPHIGHTLGASGLLETCLLLEDMKMGGVVPPIVGRTQKDDVFLSHAANARNNYILSLACGMGNIFTAAGFKRHAR